MAAEVCHQIIQSFLLSWLILEMFIVEIVFVFSGSPLVMYYINSDQITVPKMYFILLTVLYLSNKRI